ncbi:MAG: DUF4349 domain-containing protein [Tepidisphaeraceae bacterium]
MIALPKRVVGLLAVWAMCAGCASDMAYTAEKSEGMAPPPPHPPSAALAVVATPALAADKAAPVENPAGQRVVIYSGVIGLVVSDVARTLEVVRTQAVSLGGYMQEMDGASITVRVPADRFTEVVEWVAKLGEVTEKRIKSQDVTEEMRDLRIRLDNAEQTRKRLLALLEKSAKVEDTLKIETELERVTQTIELLKGKLQALTSEVAFSTLKVQVNSPLPQRQMVAQIPFEWVRQLGEGVVSGMAAQQAQSSSRDRREIRFDAPKSYIRYYDRDDTSESMSADGVIIKIQKQDNYKGGDLEFWSAMARRVLVESRAVAFERNETIKVQGDKPARLVSGTRDLAGQKSGYLLAIVVLEEKVYAFEAWGPLAAFEKDRAVIEASVKSLEPRR